MFDSPIQDILTQRLQVLPDMVMAQNLRHDIDELVARHLPAGIVAVVDDARTSTAYGDHVFRALKGRFETLRIMLPLGVQADEIALSEVEQKSQRADLLIAVGSGTINDLVKLAAHKAGKPYIIFPTAASMNGYVSRNASMSIDGHKQSLAAALPLAVFMDMQMIAEAPLRLTQAGLGDSLARPTAQADWLLSHHLLGTAYDDAPYQMIAAYEPMLFAQAGALLHGDRETLECLMKLLLVSGFGMTIAGSSIPASGAEHMVAHGMSQPGSLHGEEIAFTSVEMATRQARLLGQSKIALCALDTHADEGYSKKCAAIRTAYPDRTIPHATWGRAREVIAAIHMASEKLASIRKAAQLPEHLTTLGWDAATYRETLATARFTRDRFTCLDVE